MIESSKSPSIAIVGAGAIGGITAAFLHKAGWDVELVCKHQEIVDRALGQGLHVRGINGDMYVPVRAVRRSSELSGPKSIILLATKAADCVNAVREILSNMTEDSVLVSMQNGICEEDLAEVVGPERVVGCVVGWGASMHDPGELEMTSNGEFVIGKIDRSNKSRLQTLQEMFSTIVPTRISDNIMGELYSKLVVNASINPMGALTGLRLGDLLGNRRIRRIIIRLMAEAMAVADAKKLRVPPGGGGKLDYYRFFQGEGVLADIKRHLIMRVIGFKYRRIRSSSLQSLERGRKTETDYLNGYIVRQGRANGISTPTHEIVVGVIQEIEDGKRKIQPENIEEIGV